MKMIRLLSVGLVCVAGASPVAIGQGIDASTWDAFELIQSEPARIEGPFKCGAVALYFVLDGREWGIGNGERQTATAGPMKVTLTLTSETDEGKMRKALVRFLDADENYVGWDYQWFPPQGVIEKTWEFALDDARPGIYQLRLALLGDFTFEVQTEPEMSFGVMPMRSLLFATSPEQFGDCWMYVPPNSQKWAVSTYADTSLTVTQDQKTLLQLEGSGQKGEIAVDPKSGFKTPADGTGGLEARPTGSFETGSSPSLWHVSLRMGERAFLRSRGVPTILCPDETTARNIRASAEFLPDGCQVWHKFQKRVWEKMREFTPEDLACETERSFEPLLPELLKEPVRNARLLNNYGVLGHVRHSLEEQSLDPSSIWFGTIRAWRDHQAAGRRWDQWSSFPSYTLNATGLANNLAAAWKVPARVNPYGGDRHILNRAVLAGLADLLAIHEDDTLKNGTDGDMDPYASSTGFPANHNYCWPYLLCAPDVPEDLRALWTEGYRHIMDRYPFYRVSCENQSAHWPICYYALHLVGEAEEPYGALAHDYIVGMCDPELNRFMKTGYQQEAYGPDSTYQGLSCSLQAQYWALSGDEAALEGLRRIFRFFNHTVAPEPDGYIWGASNFCHRTQYGWQHPQYNAGRTLLAAAMPEAGLYRYEDDATDPANQERAAEILREQVAREYDPARYDNGLSGGAGACIHTGGYLKWLRHPGAVDRSGKLPVMAEERFTRNLNDEFFAIRRPAYYALVYTGHTADEWVKSRISFQPKQKCPRGGGALSLFWTPSYGSALVSMNYNAYVNHQVMAELADGKVSWPDYWSISHEWNEQAATLKVSSKLFNLPVAIERVHHFRENEMLEEVAIRFEDEVSVKALVEQIPILKNKPGFELAVIGSAEHCSGLWMGDDREEGCLIEFQEPVRVIIGQDQQQKWYSETQVNGRVMIDLGAQHHAGEELRLAYTLRGCTRPQALE